MKYNKLKKILIAYTIFFLLLSLIIFFYKTFKYKKTTEPSPVQFSKEEIEGFIYKGIDFMIRNQKDDGSFSYELDLTNGEWLDNNNYVRQAGAFYTLSQAYCTFGNQNWKKSLEKFQNFFLSRKIEKIVDNKKAIFIRCQDDQLKTNAVALFLAGLTELTNETCKAKFKVDSAVIEQLANALVVSQKESGSFQYILGQERESNYSDGENFYALARAFKATGKEEYLEAAVLSAENFLDKYQSEEKLKFYSWGMQGYSQLYEVKPNDKWSLFVFGETDKVIENRGNGVISEGVGTAALLAKNLENERFSDYKKWLDQSAGQIIDLQITERKNLASSGEKALGGFCVNSKCETSRIDLTHHNLSALIWIYRILDN